MEPLLAYFDNRTEYFFHQDNFQRKFLYEIPKLLWKTEKVEDIGDFVLLFPNPDKFFTSTGGGIKLDSAEEIFNEIFDTNLVFPGKKKFMENLKNSYLLGFTRLEEYANPSEIEEKLKAEKKKKEELEKLKKRQMEGQEGNSEEPQKSSTLKDKLQKGNCPMI